MTRARAAGTMAGMQSPHALTHYPALREQLRDGDTIALRALGLYGAALRLGQMGPYGHVGIIRHVRLDDVTRVMVIEENPGGGRYRPLSHYRDRAIDVYSAPPEICGRLASAEAVKLLEGLARYDWHDIARLARWGLLRLGASVFDDALPTPTAAEVTEARSGVICSALVSAAYLRAGWMPDRRPAWPSALCAQLGPARLQYRPA